MFSKKQAWKSANCFVFNFWVLKACSYLWLIFLALSKAVILSSKSENIGGIETLANSFIIQLGSQNFAVFVLEKTHYFSKLSNCENKLTSWLDLQLFQGTKTCTLSNLCLRVTKNLFEYVFLFSLGLKTFEKETTE